MDDPTDPSSPPWKAGRSAKQKNAVQRNVTALLDALAPERILRRVDPTKLRIEEHRTPSGCVLQAPGAALSVSWFPDEGKALGVLHVVVWSGVLSRRGSPAKRDGATLLKELALTPIDPPDDGHVWRIADGTVFDTASLAAHCLALLEEAMAGTGSEGGTRLGTPGRP